MTSLNFITENWYIFVLIIAVIVVGVFYIKKFSTLSKEQQLAKVKQWLLIAVAEAEQVLGGGTGQLKLRFVYDKFVTKFPTVAKFLSFEDFSKMVDEVLVKFNHILDTNDKVRTLIIKD